MRKRITVIGDVMIDVDHIVQGESTREGRPCLEIVESRRRLGTAGVVAQMVQALGADATLIGTSHLDDVQWIRRQIAGNSFILGSQHVTTRRERFYREDWTVAGPRLDFNPPNVISDTDRLIMAGRALGNAPDAFIVCDHARGVVGGVILDQLRSTGKPIFVDPHPKSDWGSFHSVEALVMNRDEAEVGAAADPAPAHIISKMDADGLYWYLNGWQLEDVEVGKEPTLRRYLPSAAREIVDTLGAGDQFVAALACARVQGDDMERAIARANVAAGLQCERQGIRPVTWSEVDARLNPKDD